MLRQKGPGHSSSPIPSPSSSLVRQFESRFNDRPPAIFRLEPPSLQRLPESENARPYTRHENVFQGVTGELFPRPGRTLGSSTVHSDPGVAKPNPLAGGGGRSTAAALRCPYQPSIPVGTADVLNQVAALLWRTRTGEEGREGRKRQPERERRGGRTETGEENGL